MPSRTDELDDFKIEINLLEYASADGYEVDPMASSKSSIAMKHSSGDKIIVGVNHNSHWIYWSVHEEGDAGTIIDFVQRRRGLNLGEVRQELRTWLSGDRAHASYVSASSVIDKKPEYVPMDHAAVRASYEATKCVVGHHPYLCFKRSIPYALLASDRFSGCVRTDERGNALFPHRNMYKEICGYEIKNDGFTGFAKHGSKGIWSSRGLDTDRRMVLAETAIDALSYAALFGYEDARFFSIAGQMNPHQPGLVHRAIRAMPAEGKILLAVDNDDGGEKLAEYILAIFDNVVELTGRGDLELIVDRPPTAGDDWNDVLQSRPPQPSGGGRPGPT